MLKGSCLCGGIQFTVAGVVSKIAACHCSLCRKVSGVGSLVDVAVAFDDLQWVTGKALVQTFERPSGYGVSFCRTCGSPAPDANWDQSSYCIPVGLFDEDPAFTFGHHGFVGSKACWDEIGDNAERFDGAGPAREDDRAM